MIEDENIKDDNVQAVETETPEAPEINHVSNMVSQLVDGDNVAAQDSFKNALTDKIGSALDDKRKTVANDWLNATVGNEEETETEEQEVEQEDEPVVSQTQQRNKRAQVQWS